MGNITYTKSQETAIRHRGGNLLLSAAAGSGKTATLTARILRLLLEGDENGEVNLTDMLVVTYTRAAAGELRGRISAAILEAEREWRRGSSGNPDRPHPAGNRFFRHITDVQRADISTIHSFLYKVLRPYFPALGLPADLSIIDESASDVLKASAMQDTIDDFFDSPGKPTEDTASFTELADAFGASRDAGALDEIFIDMANSLTSVGRDASCLAGWADVLDSDADKGFFRSVYGEYILDHIRLMLRHYGAVFSDISDDLFGEGGKAAASYGPALSDILNTILRGEDAAENGDYTALREIIAGYTPAALGRLTAKDKTETSEYFKNIRERFKKDMKNIAEDYFTADEASLTLSMHRTARILRMMGRVLERYFKTFARRKLAQNALDYSDLEIFALKLFLDENGSPTDAAREVGSRYKYIFIDEYQDTNHVQDDIFRAISGKAVRFMVGDIKQSIYRFRGAEPEVFSGYRDRWPVLREGEESGAEFSPDDGHCVFMSENFRCDEPVVRFVNMVSAYMFPHGGIPYTDDDALIYGKGSSVNQSDRAPVEICLIDKPRRKKTDEEEGAPVWDENSSPEAEYVADRIAAMIGRERVDGDQLCRPRDIAVILRSFRGTAEVYASALMKRGIQVRFKSGVTPLSAASSRLVMCLLNLVDNPLRDIYTAGAMRSPVFGFTTDDIVALKQYGGDLPLYLAVTRAAEAASGEDFGYTLPADTPAPEEEALPLLPEEEALPPLLTEKCVHLARWVRRQKAAARGMKADKYIESLYGELELTAIPEIFSEAAERSALNRLYESARRFESGRFGGLSGFIEYMNEYADKETEETGEENAVSIVSIHASKGLEYPVCFLAECGKDRNRKDEQKKLLFDPVLGFGMTLPDEGGLVRCDTAVRCGIAEKKRADAVSEEMRILYVAMTRARSRLIITAKTPDAEGLLAEAERDRDYFTEWSVRECASYRDIIVRAAARFGRGDFYETKIIPMSSIRPFDPEALPVSENPSDVTEETEDSRNEPMEFEKNFSFRYPFAFLSKIPSKLSVSGLRADILDDAENPDALRLSFDEAVPAEEEPDETAAETDDIPEELQWMPDGFPGIPDEPGSISPDFSAEPEKNDNTPKMPLPSFMTGAPETKGSDRGTATHLFMQFMNPDRLRTLGVDAELDRLVAERYLSEKTADLVNRTHMKRFAESSLLARMCGAEMIRREFRFNVRMEAEKFTADEALAAELRENGIRVTVQGVVDCVFRGEKGLVLVDYKTDAMTGAEYRSPKRGEEKLIRRHRDQLMYYREICSRLFGEEIAETVIYSTALGREIPVI